MILIRWMLFILCAAMALASGVARADLYGFVDGTRVSVIFSETQPADPRYVLYKKGGPNPFNESPDELSGGEGVAGAVA